MTAQIKHADARMALALASLDYLGSPYIWGGESEDEGGYDCSGFVCKVLTRVAKHWPGLYDGQRRTSRGLFSHFVLRGVSSNGAGRSPMPPGALVFASRSDGRIYHVRIHLATVPSLDVGPVSIESGGGRSTTKSPRDSLMAAAGVRLVATDRNARWSWLDPFEVLDEE